MANIEKIAAEHSGGPTGRIHVYVVDGDSTEVLAETSMIRKFEDRKDVWNKLFEVTYAEFLKKKADDASKNNQKV